MNVAVLPYQPCHRDVWDAFVTQSKNATFLLNRDYLEYHSDRFEDCSLIFQVDDKICGLLPANRRGNILHSHQGLTYGGLLLNAESTTPLVLDMFTGLIDWMRAQGMAALEYKTIPTIYHALPAEEDRYALFRHNARLVRRDVLSVVDLAHRGPVQTRRMRGARKAAKQGVKVECHSERWGDYWQLLTEHLMSRFSVPPVHKLDEIELLQQRFPSEIWLATAEHQGDVIAGVVIFETPRVAHVQYIASSEAGRELAALDLIFMTLIEKLTSKRYFDFGISNEDQGRRLNVGLIEQKEGFGARAVVHDFYRLDLSGETP